MTARADYVKWRRSAHVGCVFARFFSCRPDEYGQDVTEVSQSADPVRVAKAIASRVERLVADPSVSVATLIMPTITTVEALAKVAIALRDHPKWIVSAIKLLPPPAGDFIGVQLFREVPYQSTTRRSEILAFGPFNIFPRTRRSPVAAFELLVGEPRANDPVSQEPTDRANLAHADLTATGILRVPNLFENMLKQTKALRLKSLSGIDDHRAKAKVSFTIRPALAGKLGLEP
jgi:hypothetical protein